MKNLTSIVVLAILSVQTIFAKELISINEQGLMLEGYDMVSLLQNKKAKGIAEFSAKYHGAIYWFTSADNQAKFNQNPQKYEPAYGGYCAVAAFYNKVEPGNINNYALHDGKIYVNRNDKAQGIWNKKGPETIIKKSNENWPVLIEKFGKEVEGDIELVKGKLSLESAEKIGKKALAYLRSHNAPGGAIAVVDEAGMPIYMIRETGTFKAASDVSIGKAKTAALFGFPTKKLEDGIYGGRNSLITVGYNMLRGGLPIIVDGVVVGGIGVSGAASADQDVEIATAGLN